MSVPDAGVVKRLGYDETYRAVHDGVVGRVVERDVVVVDGRDAAAYLQGQCSQDLSGMVAGDARRSLLLTPQGKVVALVRVIALLSADALSAADVLSAAGSLSAATGPSRFLVEVERGFGEAVLERLRRFRLRVKADLDLVAWRCAEVRGPQAEDMAPGGLPGVGGVSLRLDDRFGHGWDLLATAVELPGAVPEGEPMAFEAVRIEAGIPAMGIELGESVIPQEAGIVGETVSFTKGCYTGQELVARLDARGNRVPKVLRGVVLDVRGADELPPAGAELLDGERSVGALTSVAWSPRLQAGVGLGYVRREVQPPAAVRVAPPQGGSAPSALLAEVRELPL